MTLGTFDSLIRMSETHETIVVNVNMSESDLQRANFWFHLSRWSIRFILLFFPIIGVLLLLQLDFTVDAPMFATIIIVSLVLPMVYPLLIWFQTKRGFANLQPYQRNLQYQFTPTGYDVTDSKSSAHMDWGAIVRAVESRHSFNIFFHRALFHVIPKRSFTNAADIAHLRSLLTDVLGTKATVLE